MGEPLAGLAHGFLCRAPLFLLGPPFAQVMQKAHEARRYAPADAADRQRRRAMTSRPITSAAG